MLRYGMFRLVMLTIGLLFLGTFANAQESLTQFYLLRTGYLLEGTAAMVGQQYAVQTSFGSMNVPIQNVEFVGKTKQDVYLYKKSNVDSSDGNALMQFAEWCIGNGLMQEGIAEYRRAIQAVPDGTLAAVIQQRLEGLQLEELQRTETADVMPHAEVPQTEVPQTESPVSSAVPKSVFEQYVRKIQPVLVNRCASADCHGTHSPQQFKIGISQELMGSTSRRNVQSVLRYVNLDHPAESELLSALTTSHGGMKTALSVESELYLQAVRWVQLVAKEIPLARSSENKPTGEIKPVGRNTALRPVKVSELPERFRHAISQMEHPPVQELPQQAVSDPLDPNVFNEKYH